MEQSDLKLMRLLNRVLLNQNIANANAHFSPAMLAVVGVLAGAGAFSLLFGILKLANA